MFRQLGNDFSKFAGKKNKLSKHHQPMNYYNYNFPMLNYNNQLGMMMMMQQQPYSNYQMMNNNNWGPMQWAGGSNWYGLGYWPGYPHMNNFWML